MPRDLFGDVTRPFVGVGARSRVTVPLSLLAHTLTAAAVVVVPLVATDTLPSLRGRMQVSLVTPIVLPEPPRPRVRPDRPADTPPVRADAAPLYTPTAITPESELPVDPFIADGVPVSVIPGGGSELILPVPPLPPPTPAPAAPLRVGGGIAPPVKVHDAVPQYPAIAQAARVQGIVIIQATIGTDGTVVGAEVLRSVPLLDQAALEAVRQWRYTPTRLNGEPVALVMTVTVHFRLG
jgi:protein TonB